MPTNPGPTRPPAPGFTLLEVMVVVVILAVLATLTIPRVTSTPRRTFDLAVEQVADLLLMYAQRDQLERKPVGLVYDGERGWLELRLLDRTEDGDSLWRPDPFVAPVKLPDVVDRDAVAVYADGEWAEVRLWPLTHAPGEDRPTIEILLRSIDQEHRATLRLTPHDVVPRRVGERTAMADRQQIDLDAAGRGREAW